MKENSYLRCQNKGLVGRKIVLNTVSLELWFNILRTSPNINFKPLPFFMRRGEINV